VAGVEVEKDFEVVGGGFQGFVGFSARATPFVFFRAIETTPILVDCHPRAYTGLVGATYQELVNFMS
jgi:hypothetical protein